MIDKEKFRENMKYYDKGTVAQVIDMFLADYNDVFVQLQASIDNMDFSSIDHIAHSFKSNVAYMSGELSEQARILEHKGKDQDGSGLQNIFDNLKSGTLVLAEELQEIKKEYE
jgi:HPt (histidine-containing phosphotransfer) domain-containing protein